MYKLKQILPEHQFSSSILVALTADTVKVIVMFYTETIDYAINYRAVFFYPDWSEKKHLECAGFKPSALT